MKKTHKLLILLALVCTLLVCGMMSASAEGINLVSDGGNFKYYLDFDTGEVTFTKCSTNVSGEVNLYQLTYNDVVYNITAIADEAFRDCTKVTAVYGKGLFNGSAGTLNKIKSIGKSAFEGCTSLKEVGFKKVTSIGERAFANCTALTNVEFDDVGTILDYTFYNCKSLKKYNFDLYIKYIGRSAFEGCTSLLKVGMLYDKDGNLFIGNSAFKGCTALSEVTYLNATAKSNGIIESYAFDNCHKLNTTFFIHGIKTIEPYAFNNCGIRELDIYNNITALDEYTFNGCTKLTKVDLGDNLRSINAAAFAGCINVADVIIGSAALYKNPKKLYGYDNLQEIFPDASVKSITIKDDVTAFPWETIESCVNLTTLDIGDGVTELPPYYIMNSLRKIKKLVIGDGIEEIKSYWYNSNEQLVILKIGANVKKIGDCAFMGADITELTIPDSVEEIGNSAFGLCSELKNVNISDNVKKIGDRAFYYTNIKSFKVPLSVTEIGSEVFVSWEDDGPAEVTIHRDVTTIADDAFKGNCEDMVIYGYIGTVAQTHAKEQGFIFSPLDEDHTHTYTTSVKCSPKCLIEGKTAYTCECGFRYYEPIVATGHSFTHYIYYYDATCTDNAKWIAYCNNKCGTSDTIFENGTAKGHTFTKYIVETEPTCSENGLKRAFCDNGCGESSTISIEKLGHDYQNPVVVVNGTCISGYEKTQYTCVRCNDVTEKVSYDSYKPHADNNHDGKCDTVGCKRDFTLSCDHKCHNGGFFYKFTLFFWKLFKTNKYCDCGMAHY